MKYPYLNLLCHIIWDLKVTIDDRFIKSIIFKNSAPNLACVQVSPIAYAGK